MKQTNNLLIAKTGIINKSINIINFFIVPLKFVELTFVFSILIFKLLVLL